MVPRTPGRRPLSSKGGADGVVRAGGGVVWRRSGQGIEFVLVHRPRYDDWSLAKGKADDADEGWRACAEREVEEETGYRCTAGERVAVVRYVDRHGRAKEVRYFSMRVSGRDPDTFRPNDEVDEIVWLGPKEARRRLTREADVEVLDAFLDMDVTGR